MYGVMRPIIQLLNIVSFIRAIQEKKLLKLGEGMGRHFNFGGGGGGFPQYFNLEGKGESC